MWSLMSSLAALILYLRTKLRPCVRMETMRVGVGEIPNLLTTWYFADIQIK